MEEKIATKSFTICYIVVLIAILWVGYLSSDSIISNKSAMDMFSYYGTIITCFSLCITFVEIWKTKTIQQEIKTSLKEAMTQKSLQHNPIIQKHLVSLKACLYDNKFEMAKIEVDIVKNLILHHSKYKDIMNILEKNISKSKHGFFETLENQLMKVTISTHKDIVVRNLHEFKEHQEDWIQTLTQIEAYLNKHTGEQQ